MNQAIELQLQLLDSMTTNELKAAYIEVFDERPHSHRRLWLKSRVAWGIQAKGERGMSQRFIEHGLKHADLSEIRMHAPRSIKSKQTEPEPATKSAPQVEREQRDPRIPAPGTVLERDFQGRKISIKIQPHGFEWDGIVYPSFSKAVKTATGKSYSPYAFFKLGPKPKNK
ncbi:DUF2924 domain-containing protein [Acanthopleuribacter pedis]|uniref:DUF2924 domain-containing protein n=1 Tax=Acanthopleuribacter pedis TaxID=442870 RepID=A0A8J7Q6H9_9BACT|nr:DUF2924 domain-containing protein [Acanthopleuribacter pedis]MBO1318942.1 DUF2924 domain-containing protein [Acanthopleuribacter pedis]